MFIQHIITQLNPLQLEFGLLPKKHLKDKKLTVPQLVLEQNSEFNSSEQCVPLSTVDSMARILLDMNVI